MFQLIFRQSAIAAPALLGESDTDTPMRQRLSNLLRQRRAEYQENPDRRHRIKQEGEHAYRLPTGGILQLRYAPPVRPSVALTALEAA